MITFFTTAKPFKGHAGIIQRNALASWKLLHPNVEIILFGDEEGAAEACAEFGLRHEPHVERDKSGMKFIGYIFNRAQQIATYDELCYSNCDIILTQDFWRAFRKVHGRSRPFLLIGKRWDTEVAQEIRFGSPDWEAELKSAALEKGRRREFEVDYFLFRRGLFRDIPALVNGRIYWDYWLVWKALSSGAAVIDGTRAIIAVHQNHDYGYHPQGQTGVFEDDLARRNFQLAASGEHLRRFEDATHLMTRSGWLLRTPFRRIFHEARLLGFHFFVHKTGAARNTLGLNKEGVRRLLSLIRNG